jgi:O-antigen ligase
MVLATGVVWFLLYRRALNSKERRVLAAGLFVVGLSIAFAGGRPLLERFVGPTGEGLDAGGRLTVVQTSLGLWRAHPIWGTGLGTFEVAFSRVQPPELGGRWRHAHQDGAELLVTTGLVGFTLLLFGAILVLRALWRGFRHAEGSEEKDACAAGLLAMVAALVHGLFDFGITLSANAWLLAAVVGAAIGSTGWDRSSGPREPLVSPAC